MNVENFINDTHNITKYVKIIQENSFQYIKNILQNAYISETEKNKDAFIPYFFGGTVRDYVLQNNLKNIDIIASKEIITKFVTILYDNQRIISYKRDMKSNVKDKCIYPTYILNIQAPEKTIIVKLYTHNTKTNKNVYTRACDFTCNNLIMYLDNTISSRVLIKNMNKEQTTQKCIEDCHNHILSCMVSNIPNNNNKDRNIYKLKFKLHINKFIKKGFTYIDTQQNQAVYHKDLYVKDLSTIKDINYNETKCTICLEQFSANEIHNTVVCKCNHYFHIDCLLKWMETGSSNSSKKCILCRKELLF